MKRKKNHPADAARDAALKIIGKIADRAVNVYAAQGVKVDRTDILLDLTAFHFPAKRLRLQDLLDADEFNLMHDIGGINKNLNRETFELEGGFTPRFSARSHMAV